MQITIGYFLPRLLVRQQRKHINMWFQQPSPVSEPTPQPRWVRKGQMHGGEAGGTEWVKEDKSK